jgi:glutaredoxin
MLGTLRTILYRAITTPKGDTLAPVRVPKDIARGVNEWLGSPLCSAEELERRRAARERLAGLRAAPTTRKTVREPAPVMVYFEKDRNQRLIERVKETLGARRIAFTLLDVSGDEATLAFVTREAKCERDELPVVFVAGQPVGGFRELQAFDTSGQLTKAVFGAD